MIFARDLWILAEKLPNQMRYQAALYHDPLMRSDL